MGVIGMGVIKIDVIVMGKIESGCCRVGDKCIIMPNRTQVEVININCEGIKRDSCVCGECVRLKLTNVEEEVSMIEMLFINY
jgi:peptide chain release factor subunit 3